MANTLYQVSTLQALAQGNYYGNSTIKELLSHGDIGLGTFKDLNGEMILLDGTCYRADENGHVSVMGNAEETPFAVTSFFSSDSLSPIPQPMDMAELIRRMNEEVANKGKNNIYLCRLDGYFQEVNARSELAQKEPYRPIAKAMETDQREFTFKNVKGSLVCVYFPTYMDKLNLAGWHIHFLSEDKSQGGHVFGLTLQKGRLQWETISNFHMIIPTNSHFQNLDLSSVPKDEIESVEKAGSE